jgi:hypothetical protein
MRVAAIPFRDVTSANPPSVEAEIINHPQHDPAAKAPAPNEKPAPGAKGNNKNRCRVS